MQSSAAMDIGAFSFEIDDTLLAGPGGPPVLGSPGAVFNDESPDSVMGTPANLKVSRSPAARPALTTRLRALSASDRAAGIFRPKLHERPSLDARRGT